MNPKNPKTPKTPKTPTSPVGLYCELCGGYFACEDPGKGIFCGKYCYQKFIVLNSQRRFFRHVFSLENCRLLAKSVRS